MNVKAFFYQLNKLSLTIIGLFALCILYFGTGNTITTLVRYFELSATLKNVDRSAQRQKPLDVSVWENSDLNKEVFESISSVSLKHNVLVERMEPVESVNESEYLLQTREVSLQGRYSDLLSCLSALSKDIKNIKVVSLNIRREQRGKTPVLLADVYFQTVKPLGK